MEGKEGGFGKRMKDVFFVSFLFVSFVVFGITWLSLFDAVEAESNADSRWSFWGRTKAGGPWGT